MQRVLEAAGAQIEWEIAEAGMRTMEECGTPLPDETVEAVKRNKVAIKGPITTPVGTGFRSVNVALRKTLGLFACLRPVLSIPGAGGRYEDVDLVVVRENSEGEYSGNGGRTHRGLPEEVGTEVAIFTRVGVTRIMRYAFRLAQSRPRKLLTVVTKSNAQRHGMVMWDEIAAEVAQEFPDVQWDKMLVDAMTHRMTLHPQTLDTIVATNLHADILSDLAGALAGSLGVAPTANIDPERRFPSMFEPIHGSAFDITGKGIANPIATFWTAVQMLEHLGERHAAALIMEGIEYVCEKGILTPDVGGSANTAEVTRAVVHYIDAKADIAETA